MVSWLALSVVSNVFVKCLTLSTDHPDHLRLFREYVCRNAAGKVRAVLEGVGLDSAAITACITSHPCDDEGAVQDGLTRWTEGQGRQPPSWAVLIEAMEYAKIGKQHIQHLKERLDLFGRLMCTCVCVCVRACVRACVHVCVFGTSLTACPTS